VSEVLVTIQLRFPLMDRAVLAEHLAGLAVAAIAAGGTSTSISVQGYDEEDDEA
jgi:hypothetical protein